MRHRMIEFEKEVKTVLSRLKKRKQPPQEDLWGMLCWKVVMICQSMPSTLECVQVGVKGKIKAVLTMRGQYNVDVVIRVWVWAESVAWTMHLGVLGVGIAEGVSMMDWHGCWDRACLCYCLQVRLWLWLVEAYISVLWLQFCWERSKRLHAVHCIVIWVVWFEALFAVNIFKQVIQ